MTTPLRARSSPCRTLTANATAFRRGACCRFTATPDASGSYDRTNRHVYFNPGHGLWTDPAEQLRRFRAGELISPDPHSTVLHEMGHFLAHHHHRAVYEQSPADKAVAADFA